MLYVTGKSQKEIAKILRLKPVNMNTKMHRLRKRMKTKTDIRSLFIMFLYFYMMDLLKKQTKRAKT